MEPACRVRSRVVHWTAKQVRHTRDADRHLSRCEKRVLMQALRVYVAASAFIIVR